MISNKKRIVIFTVIVSVLFSVSLFTNIYITNSKYVVKVNKKSFAIENVDKEPPTVTGVPDEDKPTNNDVTVNYYDNDQVASAKIWYNPTKKEFIGPGEDYDTNTIYTLEGWYHTEVIDRTGNKTEKTWLIDKTPPVVIGVNDGDLRNTDITISDYYDNLSGVKNVVISKNGGTETEISKNTTLTETADYKLTAIDNAGNINVINFSIDKEPPKVFGVPEEGKGTIDDVTVDYSDNKGVESAKIWYNPSEKEFTGEGENYDRNTVYTEEGWYYTVVINIAGNRTEKTWYIDKSAPIVTYRYIKKEKPLANTHIKTISGIGEHKGLSNVLNIKESQNNFLATGGSKLVYNESDFINALNNGFSTIITATSINFSNPITISGNVKIEPTSNENALRYSGYGTFITVNSGATLDLTSMAIDTQGATNHNVTGINILSGGNVIFNDNSIVDGGAGNTGIVVNSGGNLHINSCYIVNSTKGVVAKGNSTITFGNLNNGRTSEFWNNTTAILFEEYTGTTNFNQSNIKVRNNINGIEFVSGTGIVNIYSGEYYSNSQYGIVGTNGNINIYDGNIYSNAYGIYQKNSILNINGGSIYSNIYHGIYLESGYSGRMTITNTNIHSNGVFAIVHFQNDDGNCTVLGGNISGKIYLGQNDNYVNTNSSYPSFEVTPSSYYAKRKLVKTDSNEIAEIENSNVTMTANGSWYKYVDNVYIVIGEDGKVIVNHVDTSGNVLSTQTLTGRIGESYSTEASSLPGYDLISAPSNASGTFTEADIVVEYKYDISNCVVVNYEDILSGIASAKYWFNAYTNNFSGEGTDFESGTIFEDYGYYKVIAINGLGLQREVEFELNSDSFNNSSMRSNSRMLMSLNTRNIKDEYILPFNADIENIIVTSEYGYRMNPVTKKYSKHTGIDLIVIGNENEEVISIGDGIVSKIYNDDSIWGNAVEIEHTKLDGTKIYSFYAHLKDDSILLEEGMKVLQGQAIGIIGTTGNSTGIHLHFEIRTASGFGNDIDPTSYILGRESLGIIDAEGIEVEEIDNITEDENINPQEEVTVTNDEIEIEETDEKELLNEEQNTEDKNVENTEEMQNTNEPENTEEIEEEITKEEIIETDQVQEETDINNEVISEEIEIIDENIILETIEHVTETID